MRQDVAAVLMVEPVMASPSLPRLPERHRWRVTEAIVKSMLGAVEGSRLVSRTSLASTDGRMASVAREQVASYVHLPKEGMATPPATSLTEVGHGVSVLLLAIGLMPLLQAQEVAFLVGRSLRGKRVLAPSPNAPSFGIIVDSRSSVDRFGEAFEALRRSHDAPMRLPRETHWLEGTFVARDTSDLREVLRSNRASATRRVLRELRVGISGRR